MEIERRENIIYVTGAPLRGADWRIMVVPGIGTYARIAGAAEDDDDEEIDIEEFDAPEERERWDFLEDKDLADIVYRTIKADLDTAFWESAEVSTTLPRGHLNFPKKLAAKYPDAIRVRYYKNATGETRKTVEMEA